MIPSKASSGSTLGIRALLTVCLAACQGSEPPVPFARGAAIPLEQWVLKIRQTEVISPQLIAGFRDFRINNAHAKVLAVHLELKVADSDAAQGPADAEKGFVKLMASCRLQDGEGKGYPLGLPLPSSHFRMLKSGGMMSDQEMRDMLMTPSESSVPKDWVLLFAVPQERKGFKLLIRNLDPREGQPGVASVDLDR